MRVDLDEAEAGSHGALHEVGGEVLAGAGTRPHGKRDDRLVRLGKRDGTPDDRLVCGTVAVVRRAGGCDNLDSCAVVGCELAKDVHPAAATVSHGLCDEALDLCGQEEDDRRAGTACGASHQQVGSGGRGSDRRAGAEVCDDPLDAFSDLWDLLGGELPAGRLAWPAPCEGEDHSESFCS